MCWPCDTPGGPRLSPPDSRHRLQHTPTTPNVDTASTKDGWIDSIVMDDNIWRRRDDVPPLKIYNPCSRPQWEQQTHWTQWKHFLENKEETSLRPFVNIGSMEEGQDAGFFAGYLQSGRSQEMAV